VREVAAPDLAKMGLEILSFTIKDVFDDVNHLESLGQKRTAEVIRDADIAIAETGRDAGIAVRVLFFQVLASFLVAWAITTRIGCDSVAVGYVRQSAHPVLLSLNQ
jgi:uncharacterized membrane protein YqiK